ncbi:cache domain-containing sensor histidine kinase [Cohnella silvisoli]|uniref:Sensor histidine kinase n=1 Tax=Cohnella silvisoli TaxID=2873699 RepID=A0ABV1KVJ3_9BACL|nr:sensor histidine kinase [Cohnella silvisoli]MCD9023502.1 sensor histidine kinase [Cohnella silvisoli]
MKQRKHSNIVKYMYQSISIKNKIFISNIVIIVISLSILALFANIVSSKAIVDKAVNNSSRELELIDKNLQTLISRAEDFSRILATDHRLQANLLKQMNFYANASVSSDSLGSLNIKNTLSEVISNIVQPSTQIAAASVMDSNNHLFDIGYADNASISTMMSPDLIRTIKEKQVPVWTNLFAFKYNNGTAENAFAVAKAVIHKDTGKTVGIVVLYLTERDIASIYLDNMKYKGGRFYILNKNGVVISSQNKNDLYKKFNEVSNLKIKNETSIGESLIRGSGKDKVLITAHSFDKLEWKIVSVIPIEEITVENKKINQLIVIIGFACLIFAFIVSFMLSRTITRPILRIAKTMKEIHLGHLNVRINNNSLDEIGLLAKGLNSLMDRIQKLIVENYEEQKTKADIEFKLLQSQVKPHFLYNTIETVISFIKLNMREEAIMASKYLANFYRVSLSKGNDIIKIRDEVQLTVSYLEIQKLRYVEYMDFTIDFDEGIMHYSIPKLTLQPIVENAIYHGLKQKNEKGILMIKGYQKDRYIEIEIYDDGAGMSVEAINKVLKPPVKQQTESTKHTDFGVGSVNNRIKILYGDEYGLDIESEVGMYTKVMIKLPLRDE